MTSKTVPDPFDGLSSEEMHQVQELTKWSGAAIVREHRSLLRLVGKVRTKLERTVDANMADDDWTPTMEWIALYRTTVDGGAKLVESWYRREQKNSNMALTDEQLEIEIQKAAVALFEKIPLDDAERSIARRRYIETRGEERPPKGERFSQNAHLLRKADK